MIVYTATLPTGLKYVGATTGALHKRILDHKSSHTRVENKFYLALLEHGFDSAIWEIIGYPESKAEMHESEKRAIAELNTQLNGYNTTTGGAGCPGRIYTKAERLRISQGQRKRFTNPAMRAATSYATKKWLVENPERAKALTDARISTAKRVENREAASRKQRQFFADNPDAVRKMAANLSELYKSKPDIRARISKTLGGAPVQVIKAGQVISEYLTLSECAREMKLSLGNISSVLSGKRNHTGGYQFRRQLSESHQ